MPLKTFTTDIDSMIPYFLKIDDIDEQDMFGTVAVVGLSLIFVRVATTHSMNILACRG